jgi:ferredoxin
VTTEQRPSTLWQIRITNRCVGSGVCLGSAPHYFHQVAGYSQPRSSQVAPDDEVLAVAELCPMNAIEIDRGADSDHE